MFILDEQTQLLCYAEETRQHPECKSVVVPQSGPKYVDSAYWLPYKRTAPAPRPRCELGPREQANQVTSFLDGSVIYGSTMQQARTLRTFRNGMCIYFLFS